jgi:flagellar hook-length control protein FliK
LITPQTFEQAIQNQDYANLPELLEELREEVEKLLFSLNIEEKKTEKKNDLKFAEIKDFEKIEIENFAKNKEIKAEIKTEAKLELKNFTKAEIKDFIKNTEIKSEAKAEIKAEAKAENKPEAKAESVIKDFAKTEMKTGKLPKAEPEVRAVWEGADLKIETINPKTGEKLQSVPVSNAHRMQEQMNQFEVVRQVVAQAKFITTPTGEQKMTIQLRPEHLGQVELRISLHNGEMQIHARVESATAQAALENHIGLLREGLEKQGITLERLEVSVEQRENRDAYALAREQEQKRDGKNNRRKKGQAAHLAVSVAKDANADTGRRLGYNTMEYLA